MVAVFAAYAVSRYRFRGRRVFTVTVLSTQTFPGILFPVMANDTTRTLAVGLRATPVRPMCTGTRLWRPRWW